jgi:hypothetical protein
LTQLLAAIGSRRHPETVRRSPDGRVRLLVRDTPFRRAAGLAFDQIRHFGAANPTIAKKLLEALGDLAAVVPPDAREALAEQAEALARAARQAIKDPADLADVERLTATVRADTGGAGGEPRRRARPRVPALTDPASAQPYATRVDPSSTAAGPRPGRMRQGRTHRSLDSRSHGPVCLGTMRTNAPAARTYWYPAPRLTGRGRRRMRD